MPEEVNPNAELSRKSKSKGSSTPEKTAGEKKERAESAAVPPASLSATTPTPESAAPPKATAERINMPEVNVPADFTNLFLKGVEQVADLQKKSLEAALQQNAEVIASYKKSAQAATTLPNVFDMAGKALESYIEAQKSMIDQIVQQTTALVESTKGGASSPQKVAEMFTKNIEQSIERTVEVQKKALEMMVQQAKNASQPVK